MSVCRKNQQQHAQPTCPFKGRLGHAEYEIGENYIARTHCMSLYFCWICFKTDTIVSWVNRLTSNTPHSKRPLWLLGRQRHLPNARRPLTRSCRLALSRLSFLGLPSAFQVCGFKTDIYGIARFVRVFDTDHSNRCSNESDCYWEILGAGHFDFDPLTTRNGIKNIAEKLAVIRDLACACRVKGRERERRWSSRVAWQGAAVPWQGEHGCAWNERAFNWIQWSRGLWALCYN